MQISGLILLATKVMPLVELNSRKGGKQIAKAQKIKLN